MSQVAAFPISASDLKTEYRFCTAMEFDKYHSISELKTPNYCFCQQRNKHKTIATSVVRKEISYYKQIANKKTAINPKLT